MAVSDGYKLAGLVAMLAAGVYLVVQGHSEMGGLLILSAVGAPVAAAGARAAKRRKEESSE